MANLNSTLYSNLFVNKYLADARNWRGRLIVLPVEHVVSGDVNGDTVNATVIPAGHKVIAFDVAWDALGASTTMSFGDAGSGTRFLAATAVTSAGRASGPSGTAGQNYIATTDTIVLLTWGGANPTAAATVKGYFLCLAQG